MRYEPSPRSADPTNTVKPFQGIKARASSAWNCSRWMPTTHSPQTNTIIHTHNHTHPLIQTEKKEAKAALGHPIKRSLSCNVSHIYIIRARSPNDFFGGPL